MTMNELHQEALRIQADIKRMYSPGWEQALRKKQQEHMLAMEKQLRQQQQDYYITTPQIVVPDDEKPLVKFLKPLEKKITIQWVEDMLQDEVVYDVKKETGLTFSYRGRKVREVGDIVIVRWNNEKLTPPGMGRFGAVKKNRIRYEVRHAP